MIFRESENFLIFFFFCFLFFQHVSLEKVGNFAFDNSKRPKELKLVNHY